MSYVRILALELTCLSNPNVNRTEKFRIQIQIFFRWPAVCKISESVLIWIWLWLREAFFHSCGLCSEVFTPERILKFPSWTDEQAMMKSPAESRSTHHYELPMEKKVPWNGAVSMRSRAGSWETLSICITLRHNQGAPADMHANALGILIICRFPLA